MPAAEPRGHRPQPDRPAKRPNPIGAAVLLAVLLPSCEVEPEHGPPQPFDDAGSGGGVSDVAPVTAPDADAAEPEPDCLDGLAENELGVGRRCEAGGQECDDTGRVSFCSVDFLAEDVVAMCTFPCNDTPDCGEDAVCAATPEDPEGTHCWPVACVEEDLGGS